MGCNLHLVDDEGRPLPKHVVNAVERLEPVLNNQFSRSCDPAELSTSVETRARKIAKRQLPDNDSLTGFTWRALFNGAISLARKRSREQSLSAEALRDVAGIPDTENPETKLARIQEKETLFSEFSPREREYWALREQGFNDNEVADYLQLSKNALAQLKHRLKTKLVGKGLLKK